MTPESRALFVTGGPGTGKTEVVLQCAWNANAEGMKVLIACPIGPLIAMYRKRIPAKSNIVVETIHNSFKITRKADQIYTRPSKTLRLDHI